MSDDVRFNPNKPDYGFDPGYGYSVEQLLAVRPPREAKHFAQFWQHRYQNALATAPNPELTALGAVADGRRLFAVRYTSTGGFPIGGWLLLPKTGTAKRGLIVGHGYGGRDGPDLHLPFADAALLFPCFRGLGLSRQPGISDNPFWHVRHHIDNPKLYILGGCVDDVWLAASALLALFPRLAGKLGYLGMSFGGGIGALALACERRIARGHLNVPTFGHQPLRLRLPSQGSAHSVQQHYRHHKRQTLRTLRLFDAATAARHIGIPMHCALALFDPCVAPPGQFAIYNALPGRKELFILEAGHYSYPNQHQQEQQLLDSLQRFFAPLGF